MVQVLHGGRGHAPPVGKSARAIPEDGGRMSGATCRFCASPLGKTFSDLGMSPLSNAYLKPEQLGKHESFYPLHAWVCEKCLLVQLEQFEPPERIFTDEYAYFSSFSDTWLEHSKAYVDAMIGRFGFGPKHLAVEIASNDGYLL